MADTLLAVTLFGPSGAPQLCGPAMVKTKPSHQLSRVIGTFCRWAGVPPEAVSFHNVNGKVLPAHETVQACNLASGHAITVILQSDSQQPISSAAAAPFAMLDGKLSVTHTTVSLVRCSPLLTAFFLVFCSGG